jgi:hypothetical protein
MGPNMQRPLPANQLNWLKTVWAGRRVGTWGTIAAEWRKLRRAFGLSFNCSSVLLCEGFQHLKYGFVLPNALSSDHLMRKKVFLSNGQEPSAIVGHSFFSAQAL